MVNVPLDQFGDDADRHGLVLRRRNESERINEFVPRQRESEDARRNQPGHCERQDDLDQDLPARGAVDQRTFLQFVRDRAEVAHQQPGAERNQESRVSQDQRPLGIEDPELEHHGRQRNEQDRRRHQVRQKDCEAGLPRAPEPQPLDRVGGEHARGERQESGDHRNDNGVPHPRRIRGFEEQFLEMVERRILYPEWVAVGRQQFRVRLERGQAHPVEREQQDEQKNQQRDIDRHPAPRQRLQVIHSFPVGRFIHGSRLTCQNRPVASGGAAVRSN